jgi:hypothetical protein
MDRVVTPRSLQLNVGVSIEKDPAFLSKVLSFVLQDLQFFAHLSNLAPKSSKTLLDLF